MSVENFISSVIGSLLANFIIIVGKHMSLYDKYRTNYNLVKKVYIFGFFSMFMIFGFFLFRSEGIEKIIPIVFLVISTIAALCIIKTNKKPQVQTIESFKNKPKKLYTTTRQERENLQKPLTPEAIEVLRVIAAMLSPFGNNRQEATIDETALSETLGISHQQTKHLLELLDLADMLEANDMGIYGITGEGRKLLNEKEKMP